MIWWLASVVVGGVIAWLHYRANVSDAGRRVLPAALSRALAATLLAALALDAPIGRAAPQRPLIALDVSASWLRGDTLRWRSARDRARALAVELDVDSLLVFGDSVRVADAPATAHDAASRVGPAVEPALAAGRALVILTDGVLDDAASLSELPTGSRVEIVPPGGARAGPDAAVSTVEAPHLVVGGDSIEIRVAIVVDTGGAPAGIVSASLDGIRLVAAPVTALGPWGETLVTLRAVAPRSGARRSALLRVAVQMLGDVERRNDTVTVTMEIAPAAGAVVLSTSPDQDVRFALALLRGTLALPARGFLQIARGQWRIEGTLASVPEAEVRRAVNNAPLIMLHGDTSVFGPPAALGQLRAPLVLMPSPPEDEGATDWYASAAPDVSPLTPALSGIFWDSLAPLSLSASDQVLGPARSSASSARGADWVAMEARGGRRGQGRAVVMGRSRPRRTVVVTASGFWRWQFRGGHGADTFAAMWGGIFDWLAEERADSRAALPSDHGGALRAGDTILWRRAGSADSIVSMTVTRRGRERARVDTVALRFGASNVASAPALAAGVYDVAMPGGRVVLAVNASREWLPRRMTVRAGPVGSRAIPSARTVARLRGTVWPFALVLVLLCAEWIWRRRIGLR